MKKVGKPVVFIVAGIILIFSYFAIFGCHGHYGDMPVTYIKGVSDIRWGIDIKGGVEATFSPAEGVEATDDQLNSAKAIIETRMVSNNITDYELYADYGNKRIIVRFPWKSGEVEFNPETAIEEISSTAVLTFREGKEYTSTDYDKEGKPVMKTPKGVTSQKILVEGKDVVSARAALDPSNKDMTKQVYSVELVFNDEGKAKFAEATKNNRGKPISIWMDDVMLSAPNVSSSIPSEGITDGKAVITGDFSGKEARSLATKIEAGALPFKLQTTNFSTISPTLGESSLYAMLMAGIIAFIVICVMMIMFYRLPGIISCIALIGHLALTFAFISGFFSFINSFTMTLPGIAGIILSIGMGVDANIIIASRIKEEVCEGKPLSKAISSGSKNSFWAIFDGNITVIIVALILMGIFGPTNILSFIFGASTTGSIYSFGYTLLIGVICNFIMGITATRLMTKSISKYSFASNPWLYGGGVAE